MIQSDALSRRPDLCPENDNDNEDIIMLPDDLFLNLINLELQKKIAISDDLDGNAADVEFSDKTLYFAFCDTQSHAVTVTTIVLHSYIIYLPPLIVISMLVYVWCTFEILI